MFSISFGTGNAAFGDTQQERAIEIARILAEVAASLTEHLNVVGPIRDLNGNLCGSWKIE